MDMFSYLSSIDNFIDETQERPQLNLLDTTDSPPADAWATNPQYENTASFSDENDTSALLVPPVVIKPFVQNKMRKKPYSSNPSTRREQNRAAQRAYRERKERYVETLEKTIHSLHSQLKEMENIKKSLEKKEVEVWYLKGTVLTLQLVCMQHNINVPTHAPYLSDYDLQKITAKDSFAQKAYIDAYAKNNASLKSFFAKSNSKCTTKKGDFKSTSADEPEWIAKIDESDIDKITSKAPIPHLKEETLPNPLTSNLDAIHYIQLKLIVKSFRSGITDLAATRLRPSVLQMAIPHDPRIDLIPIQHMRDRMILFHDQLDYNSCFSRLIDGSTFLGGDPTDSNNWQLPAEFYEDFWFLALNYRMDKLKVIKKMIGSTDESSDPFMKISPMASWPDNSPKYILPANTSDRISLNVSGNNVLQNTPSLYLPQDSSKGNTYPPLDNLDLFSFLTE